MRAQRKDGQLQEFEGEKITQTIGKAFRSTGTLVEESVLKEVIEGITKAAAANKPMLSVEVVQDLVEEELIQHQFYREAKNYILYRQKRTESRKVMQDLVHTLQKEDLHNILTDIQRRYPNEGYNPRHLLMKFHSFLEEDMGSDEWPHMLVKASVELISKGAPKWEYIASRFLSYALHGGISVRMQELELPIFSEELKYLEEQGYYGDYIRKAYNNAEIDELSAYLRDKRDCLFTYSGLELVKEQYLMCSHAHEVSETPQGVFMDITVRLTLPEQNRVYWAEQICDILFQLQVTMAALTMSDARKPYHQPSGCFIDTVENTLDSIYKNVDNFAQVSKYGGGIGLYFGKVRANGNDIRGFGRAAGGVIYWIKLVNDTATAVDQLEVRQGAVTVYLDAWHEDPPEFLGLRTNNEDGRIRTYDVFPAVCYPDLFQKMAKEDLNATWYLVCPREIRKIKGYHLEDLYGEERKERYFDCVQDPRVPKRTMVLKDLVCLILKSAVETGMSFTFNYDRVSRMDSDAHAGMIYYSDLYIGIAQNMKALKLEESRTVEIDGESVVVNESKLGDFVVCNLASLSLGNIDVDSEEGLSHIIHIIVRALDNIIDLNHYLIPCAKIINRKHRPIGPGINGYHHMPVRQNLRFESEEHLQYADTLFEKISYYVIQASTALAREKGSYSMFAGSDWQNGAYFTKRGYTSDAWSRLFR